MSTIYDIAKKAGVSPSTVSRVLNNYNNVRAETAAKVKKVCEDLNYIPNANASNLKKRNSKNLALIIPNIENPFFTSILKGFEDRAYRESYTTIVCDTDHNSVKEKDYIEMVIAKDFDGLAIGTTSKSNKYFKEIVKRKIPFLLIDRKIDNLSVDIVCGDSYQGALLLTNHLIKNGYRKIGFITGPLHLSTSKERLAGYKSALVRSDIDYDDNLVKIDKKNEGYSLSGAYNLTKELLAETTVDSIFVGNNMMALAVYKALKEKKIKVPTDLALVCFDELSLMYEIEPFFTVMKQPAYTMGELAAKTLIKRIENKIAANKQNIVLQPELIIRESSQQKMA